MKSRIGSTQSGFSLVELMVAMVVTMMVSGAVYGLLAGGQTAFRREPELTDRQQNIRSAMDMIMRDIANAGAGMPPFMQTFSRNLNACADCPMGPGGEVTDELEILTNPGLIESEPACDIPGNASPVLRLVRGTSAIPQQISVIVVMNDGTWTVRNITDITPNPPPATSGNCAAGAGHVQMNFNSGANDASGLNPNGGICQQAVGGLGSYVCPPGPPCNCIPSHVTFGEVVRYRIRNDANGVPVLQRYTTGNPAAGFQAVATGIEDLQVEYTQQNALQSPPTDPNGAPEVLNGNLTSLITEVRVTLSARSEAGNLQGQTSAAGGVRDALRGRLVSAGSPRNALFALNRADPTLWK